MTPSWQKTKLSHGLSALTGGEGAALVLLPGWPETAEAYSEVFAPLAEHYRVLAIDPPGLGESEPAPGYDTAGVAKVLSAAVQESAPAGIHLVGHDVGGWIAYAWAAQFPAQVLSLSLFDTAVPGVGAPQSFPLSPEVNEKLWQFSFNTLPDLPEILTVGRERQLFDWMFAHKATQLDRIPQANRDRYVESYSRPGAMSRGFAYYRAVAQSAAQNREFSRTKLPMPVLALGGDGAVGDRLRASVGELADHVEGGSIPDCGHYVMEEQPEGVTSRLLEFLARTGGHR